MCVYFLLMLVNLYNFVIDFLVRIYLNKSRIEFGKVAVFVGFVESIVWKNDFTGLKLRS